jgi:hypothetical protein
MKLYDNAYCGGSPRSIITSQSARCWDATFLDAIDISVLLYD